jgi:predicted dehydrogenase
MKEKYQVKTHEDLEKAFGHRFDAVTVATPPNSHIPIASASIDHGAHVFIEKPMSNSLDNIDELLEKGKKQNKIIFVGYNFRFHPGIRFVKEKIEGGEIGRVLSARAEFGQYLPDWRPWQDYRKSYTSRKDLGGGIILDGSHEIDYIRWFLGEVSEVSCFADRISSLEVETEDTAEILLRLKSGAIVGIHLDFVQRAYSRNCKLIGEKGVITWSLLDKNVGIYSAERKKWQIFSFETEINDMYVNEIKHFINCVLGKEKPLIDGADGKETLRVALAAKKSAETKKVVKM